MKFTEQEIERQRYANIVHENEQRIQELEQRAEQAERDTSLCMAIVRDEWENWALQEDGVPREQLIADFCEHWGWDRETFDRLIAKGE